MENTPYSLASDPQRGSPLPVSSCLDPPVAFQLGHETRRFPWSQDAANILHTAEPPLIKHYFGHFYNIPNQPNCQGYSPYEDGYGPSYIRKRNERERQRVKCVNEGYARLRRHLPPEYLEKRLSKVQTLKAAIKYICLLQETLCWEDTDENKDQGLQDLLKRPSPLRMHRCVRPLCVDHRCCSVPPPLLSVHSCHSVSVHSEHFCRCSLTAHSCVTHQAVRCVGGSLCPLEESAGRQISFRCPSPVAPHTAVLARRQRDGFYYLASVKQEECQGVFLIEFDKPAGGRHQTQLQKTAADDLIPYYDALRHCIVPGDTVLSPWEPEQVRYGPGIVTLGLETRDPLRVTEDEELTVSFWNGKKASVPLGVAVWVSPSVYWRVMDALHQPIGSRKKVQDGEVAAHACADRFTSAPQLCLGSQLNRHEWLQRSACSPHAHRRCACCCYPKYPTCTCCWDPKCPDWWSLTPTATVYIRGKKEDGEDASLSSRLREISTREKSLQLSSSSESEEETEESLDDDDDDSDQETWLSKTTLSTTVDSGVNTDSSLWDKPQADISDRPEWKYWRRSPPEPFHRKPGHGEKKMKSTTSKADSGASWLEGAGSTNQSALFERIGDSPGKRLTVRDVLAHKDFNPSDARSAPPAVERLGESEGEKLRRKQAVLETRKEKIIKHREWEEKREQNEDQKYSNSQEAHRVKTLQRLKHEDVKLKEKEARGVQSIKAKQEARESNSLRLQTIAAEDKQREQRRMEHLRHVREKIDQREFEKCAANERREIKQEEARRRKVNDRYREVAEKVALDEKQETRSGIRIQAET